MPPNYSLPHEKQALKHRLHACYLSFFIMSLIFQYTKPVPLHTQYRPPARQHRKLTREQTTPKFFLTVYCANQYHEKISCLSYCNTIQKKKTKQLIYLLTKTITKTGQTDKTRHKKNSYFESRSILRKNYKTILRQKSDLVEMKQKWSVALRTHILYLSKVKHAIR